MTETRQTYQTGRMNLLSQQMPLILLEALDHLNHCWSAHATLCDLLCDTEDAQTRTNIILAIKAQEKHAAAAQAAYHTQWLKWQAALALQLAPVLEDNQSDFAYLDDTVLAGALL